MSDKNIIEKLKIEKQKWVDKIYGVGETRIDLMIDDVISELETKNKELTRNKVRISSLQYQLEKQDKELETYKKIAEKLAVEVEMLDDKLSAEIGNYTKGYCNIENGCIFNYKRKCSECIIDWARKEVENEKE